MITLGEESPKNSDSVNSGASAQPGNTPEKTENGMFTPSGVSSDTEVEPKDVSSGSVLGLSRPSKPHAVTSADKKRFIDSVVGNSRFEKNYTLFGGAISFTVRSLTGEEVQALAAWTIKQSTSDPVGNMAGKYRKYLMAAQISMYNGTAMPPLEQPLFETLGSDGKTLTPPGWVDRCSFWDDKGSGVIKAIMDCLGDFDALYTTLCNKAEDESFWHPDTP